VHPGPAPRPPAQVVPPPHRLRRFRGLARLEVGTDIALGQRPWPASLAAGLENPHFINKATTCSTTTPPKSSLDVERGESETGVPARGDTPPGPLRARGRQGPAVLVRWASPSTTRAPTCTVDQQPGVLTGQGRPLRRRAPAAAGPRQRAGRRRMGAVPPNRIRASVNLHDTRSGAMLAAWGCRIRPITACTSPEVRRHGPSRTDRLYVRGRTRPSPRPDVSHARPSRRGSDHLRVAGHLPPPADCQLADVVPAGTPPPGARARGGHGDGSERPAVIQLVPQGKRAAGRRPRRHDARSYGQVRPPPRSPLALPRRRGHMGTTPFTLADEPGHDLATARGKWAASSGMPVEDSWEPRFLPVLWAEDPSERGRLATFRWWEARELPVSTS